MHYYQVTEKRTVPNPDFEKVRPQLEILAREKGIREAREKLIVNLRNNSDVQTRPAENAGR
jgi:hypothetical protein